MAQILTVLIRTFLGILVGVAGLLLIAIGLYFVFDVNFPQFELVAAMAASVSIGACMLYVGGRLLAPTLRMSNAASS